MMFNLKKLAIYSLLLVNAIVSNGKCNPLIYQNMNNLQLQNNFLNKNTMNNLQQMNNINNIMNNNQNNINNNLMSNYNNIMNNNMQMNNLQQMNNIKNNIQNNNVQNNISNNVLNNMQQINNNIQNNNVMNNNVQNNNSVINFIYSPIVINVMKQNMNVMMQQNQQNSIQNNVQNNNIYKQILDSKEIKDNPEIKKYCEKKNNTLIENWKKFIKNVKNGNIKCIFNLISNDECKKNNIDDQIVQLMKFYTGEFKPETSEGLIVPQNSVEALVIIIANYYAFTLINGGNISEIQNNLSELNNKDEVQKVLEALQFDTINILYYAKMLNNKNLKNKPKTTFDNISVEDWNKAVKIVKDIKLDDALNNLVKVTNIFKNNLSNEADQTQQILLKDNSNNNSIINSAVNLINLAVENTSSKMKDTWNTKMTNLLQLFLEYSKKEDNKPKNAVEILNDYIYTEIDPDVKDIFFGEVENAKSSIEELKKTSDSKEKVDLIAVLKVFSKIFPEMKDIFYID